MLLTSCCAKQTQIIRSRSYVVSFNWSVCWGWPNRCSQKRVARAARGPFSGSCWRFLGLYLDSHKISMDRLCKTRYKDTNIHTADWLISWCLVSPCHIKGNSTDKKHIMRIPSVYPPPRIPVTNEGLYRNSLLKMVHNPGADSSWVEGVVPRKFHPIPILLPFQNALVCMGMVCLKLIGRGGPITRVFVGKSHIILLMVFRKVTTKQPSVGCFLKPVVNNGISTTNLNWWVYRISTSKGSWGCTLWQQRLIASKNCIHYYMYMKM